MHPDEITPPLHPLACLTMPGVSTARHSSSSHVPPRSISFLGGSYLQVDQKGIGENWGQKNTDMAYGLVIHQCQGRKVPG